MEYEMHECIHRGDTELNAWKTAAVEYTIHHHIYNASEHNTDGIIITLVQLEKKKTSHAEIKFHGDYHVPGN